MKPASSAAHCNGQDVLWKAFWAAMHAALEADGALPDLLVSQRDGRSRVNPGSVLGFAAAAYGFTVADLISRSQRSELADARALAVWGMLNCGAGWSYHAIATAMGGKSVRTIQNFKYRAAALLERPAQGRFAGAWQDMRRHFAQAAADIAAADIAATDVSPDTMEELP